MRKKVLPLILAIFVVAAVIPTIVPPAVAVSDSMLCDEYHDGGGMNADCANQIFYAIHMGMLGEL